MKEKKEEKAVSACGCGCAAKDENRDNGKKDWKKPTLEDVSGRVMAQPYIRFT